MEFMFTPSGNMGFMEAFALATGSVIADGQIQIPASLGEGIIRFISIAAQLNLIIFRCTLKEELIFKRQPAVKKTGGIIITFHTTQAGKPLKNVPVNARTIVQISSNEIAYNTHIPAHIPVYVVVVAVHALHLAELLGEEHQANAWMAAVFSGKPFMYEALVTPGIEQALQDITVQAATLPSLFYRMKAIELIYYLFTDLMKREEGTAYAINKQDAEKIYAVRDTVLADLSVPPQLSALAQLTGMSETKMKRLFKQVFGNSIFNYYQEARMNAAATLITTGGYSVSEAGYQLGFSNLSHFARLFARHMGSTPKKYSR